MALSKWFLCGSGAAASSSVSTSTIGGFDKDGRKVGALPPSTRTSSNPQASVNPTHRVQPVTLYSEEAVRRWRQGLSGGNIEGHQYWDDGTVGYNTLVGYNT